MLATKAFNEIVKQAEALTLDEQLRLIAHLAEKLRETCLSSKPRRQWREIRGAAQYPLLGEDAQGWVFRARHESDSLT